MIIYDENTAFSIWAIKWIRHKSVGMSFAYCNNIRSQVAHLINAIGETPISDVKTMQLNDLIENLAVINPNTHRPASKKFLKELRNDAIQIFNFVADNCIGFEYNPARRVSIPKNSIRNERRALTEKEINLILNLEHKARPAILIMMLCGLRVGELLPLRWEDLNFKDNVIYINKSTQRISGNEFTVKNGTKNGKNRTIPIPIKLAEELRQFQKECTSPYICSNSLGKLHTPCSWKRLFESYIADLNALNNKINKYAPSFRKTLDKITPHMLRHTYASMLYFSGVDVLTAQKLLGHADVSTTLKIYTHLKSQTEKLSIEKFDNFVSDLYTTNQ